MEKNESTEGLSTQGITIPVLGGVLQVSVRGDVNYPGVDVEYIPDKDSNEALSWPRVTMEMSADKNEDNCGELRAFVWDDPHSEDYTKKVVFGNYGKK